MTLWEGITYVVPCGGAKLPHPAPARDLYVGSLFRHTLAAAEQSARLDGEAAGLPARVLILSALHGLVEPDTVLAPYDQRMDAPGSVTAARLAEQATALGIEWGAQVYALLPRPYLRRLDEALRSLDVWVQDVYEACGGGMGEQKRVNVHIGRPPVPAQVEPDGPGPVVWLGGDVSALWWGRRVLVSYVRLRRAKTLPVAVADWLLDSGGYDQLMRHGGWTVSVAEYAADIRRYGQEIGRLRWVAPQDWPASRAALARTGLSEEEHQRRTVASVVDLRAADTGVHIAALVTGTTPAGYLRHVDMYAQAGIDLRAEPIVAVGALLRRPVREAAEIVRLLHAAGLRLHTLGGKGPLLGLVGGLIESTDSADWSGNARRHVGRCRHGLVVWEANCPQAAAEWGVRQRELAAGSAAQPMLPLAC
ncbi:DUF6884 domain-containing protein [Verrucosispora sp. WMMC514]|uniref:deazapurine DNA modification protein DpdA family protein n=1 Tax=Verrucosispora sp. WMMC514 TaxID=3015156 RepID=UPI00248C02C2|nr:DUF6884 domain-containing protein [Verrucosispora sp. WMMC514]WBB94101.1 hypothetical protein O7597_14565 [Verrucosispora sp. WMMC514]